MESGLPCSAPNLPLRSHSSPISKMKAKKLLPPVFLLLSGCSLVVESPDLCSENTQCQSAFGDAYFCSSEGTCEEGTLWTFEAEGSYYQHSAGSEDGAGWACTEESGLLLYGPWYMDFPPGRFTAQYIVRTDQQSLTELVAGERLGRMDVTVVGLVTDEDSSYIPLVSTDLTVDVFESVETHAVEVDFELEASLWDLEWNDADGNGPRPSVELNLNCQGEGYLNADKVQVLQVD